MAGRIASVCVQSINISRRVGSFGQSIERTGSLIGLHALALERSLVIVGNPFEPEILGTNFFAGAAENHRVILDGGTEVHADLASETYLMATLPQSRAEGQHTLAVRLGEATTALLPFTGDGRPRTRRVIATANEVVGDGRSGPDQGGIVIGESSGNRIQGNQVGGKDSGNRGVGVLLKNSTASQFGGDAPASGNVVVANQSHGLHVTGPESTANRAADHRSMEASKIQRRTTAGPADQWRRG